MILSRSRTRLIERTALAGAVSLLWSASAHAASGCGIRLLQPANAVALESQMNASAKEGYSFMGIMAPGVSPGVTELGVVVMRCTNPPSPRKTYEVLPAGTTPSSVGTAYKGRIVFTSKGSRNEVVIVER